MPWLDDSELANPVLRPSTPATPAPKGQWKDDAEGSAPVWASKTPLGPSQFHKVTQADGTVSWQPREQAWLQGGSSTAWENTKARLGADASEFSKQSSALVGGVNPLRQPLEAAEGLGATIKNLGIGGIESLVPGSASAIKAAREGFTPEQREAVLENYRNDALGELHPSVKEDDVTPWHYTPDEYQTADQYAQKQFKAMYEKPGMLDAANRAVVGGISTFPKDAANLGIAGVAGMYGGAPAGMAAYTAAEKAEEGTLTKPGALGDIAFSGTLGAAGIPLLHAGGAALGMGAGALRGAADVAGEEAVPGGGTGVVAKTPAEAEARVQAKAASPEAQKVRAPQTQPESSTQNAVTNKVLEKPAIRVRVKAPDTPLGFTFKDYVGEPGQTHNDLIAKYKAGLKSAPKKEPYIQRGFIDQSGKFVARPEAREEVNAALPSGTPKLPTRTKGGTEPGKPHSEDLSPQLEAAKTGPTQLGTPPSDIPPQRGPTSVTSKEPIKGSFVVVEARDPRTGHFQRKLVPADRVTEVVASLRNAKYDVKTRLPSKRDLALASAVTGRPVIPQSFPGSELPPEAQPSARPGDFPPSATPSTPPTQATPAVPEAPSGVTPQTATTASDFRTLAQQALARKEYNAYRQYIDTAKNLEAGEPLGTAILDPKAKKQIQFGSTLGEVEGFPETSTIVPSTPEPDPNAVLRSHAEPEAPFAPPEGEPQAAPQGEPLPPKPQPLPREPREPKIDYKSLGILEQIDYAKKRTLALEAKGDLSSARKWAEEVTKKEREVEANYGSKPSGAQVRSLSKENIPTKTARALETQIARLEQMRRDLHARNTGRGVPTEKGISDELAIHEQIIGLKGQLAKYAKPNSEQARIESKIASEGTFPQKAELITEKAQAEDAKAKAESLPKPATFEQVVPQAAPEVPQPQAQAPKIDPAIDRQYYELEARAGNIAVQQDLKARIDNPRPTDTPEVTAHLQQLLDKYKGVDVPVEAPSAPPKVFGKAASGARAIMDVRGGRVYPEGTAAFDRYNALLQKNVGLSDNFHIGTLDKDGNFIKSELGWFHPPRESGGVKGMSKGSVVLPQKLVDAARALKSTFEGNSVVSGAKDWRKYWQLRTPFLKFRDEYATQGAGVLMQAAGNVKARVALMSKLFDSGEAALDALPEKEQLDFIRRGEQGLPQATPELQQLHNTVKYIDDLIEARTHEVAKELGIPSKVIVRNFRPWYVGRVFENEDAGKAAFVDWETRNKRSYLGKQGYNIPRSYQDIGDAMSAAEAKKLKLKSPNAFTLLKQRFGEHTKFVEGLRAISKMDKLGITDTVPRDNTWVPEPSEFRSILEQRGKQHKLDIAKKHYMPESLAHLVQNHLSKGLWTHPWYQTFRIASNEANQLNLGLSGFHYLMTANSAANEDFALGLQKLLAGKPSGLINMARAPFPGMSAAKMGYEGIRFKNYMFEHGVGGPEGDMVKAYMDANQPWQPTKDQENWSNAAIDSFKKALRSPGAMNKVSLLPKAGMALIEAHGLPLWQMVASVKRGAFMERAAFELSRLPATATEADRLEVLRGVGEHGDNIFGMVNYENNFWDKGIQNALHVVMRSPGWSMGDLRQYGGAVDDLLHAKPTRKVAYLIATPIVTAIQSTMYQKYMTGTFPQVGKTWRETARNFSQPENGEKKADGTPMRVMHPSYNKDLIAGYFSVKDFLAGDPQTAIQLVTNKVNPLLGTGLGVVLNRDYKNEEIRSAGDSLGTQAKDVGKYVSQQLEPIAYSQHQRRSELEAGTGSAPSKLESYLGIQPANPRLSYSPLQDALMKARERDLPRGPYTHAEIQSRNALNMFKAQLRHSPERAAEIQRQYLGDPNVPGSSKLTPAQIKKATTQVFTPRADSLAENIDKSKLPTLLQYYDLAQPDEREKLVIAIGKKYGTGSLSGNVKLSDIKPYSAKFASILMQYEHLKASRPDLLNKP